MSSLRELYESQRSGYAGGEYHEFSDLESKLLSDKYHVPSQKIIESTPGFSRDLFPLKHLLLLEKK